MSVDGRDPELFERFFQVRDEVRRADAGVPGRARAGGSAGDVHRDAQRRPGRRPRPWPTATPGSGSPGWTGGCRRTPTLVEVELAVDPQYRRQGVGTLPARGGRRASARRTAAACCPTSSSPTPTTGESAGTAFAAKRGVRPQACRTASGDRAAAVRPNGSTSWSERIAGQHDGYRIVQWREHTPDEWLEQFADALSVMTEDVPHRRSGPGADPLDAGADPRGRGSPAQAGPVLPHHRGGGAGRRLAAYTQMGGAAAHRNGCTSGTRSSVRTHRGRRLGMAVKIPNLRSLQARPGPPGRPAHLERPGERTDDRRQRPPRLPSGRPPRQLAARPELRFTPRLPPIIRRKRELEPGSFVANGRGAAVNSGRRVTAADGRCPHRVLAVLGVQVRELAEPSLAQRPGSAPVGDE